MAVSVTGPRAVNELGGPVIPGIRNGLRWFANRTPMWRVDIANVVLWIVAIISHLKVNKNEI